MSSVCTLSSVNLFKYLGMTTMTLAILFPVYVHSFCENCYVLVLDVIAYLAVKTLIRNVLFKILCPNNLIYKNNEYEE